MKAVTSLMSSHLVQSAIRSELATSSIPTGMPFKKIDVAFFFLISAFFEGLSPYIALGAKAHLTKIGWGASGVPGRVKAPQALRNDDVAMMYISSRLILAEIRVIICYIFDSTIMWD